MATDAGGHAWAASLCLDDSDKATASESDVETRVQTLNFLSGRSRSPRQKEKPRNGSEEKVQKGRPKPSANQEAHVLGAWLQDERVLELLNFHLDAKKNSNAINTSTESQPEVPQMKANGRGTSISTPGAGSEPGHDSGPTAPAAAVAIPTSSTTRDQMSSSAKHGRTLISL
mmetsp:Transcript_99495/g.138173  ORF Transcript_99495/g.138173 Transcript_99495/m.138173 type:complete len:172 (-) Transcript_99495:273-788(-)